MAASFEDFLAVKNSYANRLLLPSLRAGVLWRTRSIHVVDAVASAGCNVHGIGVGSKMVEGKPTEDLCIRIYVIQKLPKSLIAPHFHLPETLDGLPTDIIESRPAVLLAERRSRAKISGRPKAKRRKPTRKGVPVAEAKAPMHGFAAKTDCTLSNLTSMQRPLFGGISSANIGVFAGTLGCFCRSTRESDKKLSDRDNRYILSNRHILGNIDGDPDNNQILQPSVANNGTMDHCIAHYARAANLDLSPLAPNKVDAAIARILPEVEADFEVCGIGRLGGPVTVKLNKPVRKCGKTTGWTTGMVRSVSESKNVPLPRGRSVHFVEQIYIESVGPDKFIGDGDSGSIVFDGDSNGVVGLICGGDPEAGWAIANPIQYVLESLEIELL